jgi:biopolymer transport protein ExbD
MPKHRRKPEQRAQLDLASFMNVVVILIPMLLLSVIFISVGVLNVSTNLTASEPSQDPDETEPLNLTVGLAHDGFEIMTNKKQLAPVQGCPDDGPTICLSDASFDVTRAFVDSKRLYEEGRSKAAQKALDEAMHAYDFRRLYNELSAIKKDHPDETKLIVTGDPDMPYAILIRAMDVARFQLDQHSYRERSQFWAANEKVVAGKNRALFSDPVMAVAQ